MILCGRAVDYPEVISIAAAEPQPQILPLRVAQVQDDSARGSGLWRAPRPKFALICATELHILRIQHIRHIVKSVTYVFSMRLQVVP
jgi:hypothetical protein